MEKSPSRAQVFWSRSPLHCKRAAFASGFNTVTKTVHMARRSADDTMIHILAIKYLKQLVPRWIFFAILSVPVVYIAADYEVRNTELFLRFVIAFATMLTIITMTLELIAWLYSWLYPRLVDPSE